MVKIEHKKGSDTEETTTIKQRVAVQPENFTDDIQLMLRVRDGDEDAFRQIVEGYKDSILGLCIRYLGNQEDAEEVAQDVFIRLHKAASSYEPRAKLSTYLYRIAVNLSLNRIRDRKWNRLVPWDVHRKYEEKNPMISAAHSPDQLLEQKEKQEMVRKVIDTLPPNQKTALLLKRFQGLSYEEIARVMDCSISAVESRLHRAKLNLEKKLRPFIP